MIYLPPREKPPLREEPELLDRPNPPEGVGLLEDGLLGELEKERCDTLGLEIALAFAAVLVAFGETAELEKTGCDELFTVEPAERDLIAPL